MWNIAHILAMLDENLTRVVDRCAAHEFIGHPIALGVWHAAGEQFKVNATRAPMFKLWRQFCIIGTPEQSQRGDRWWLTH